MLVNPNAQLKDIINALQGRLTLVENIQAVVIELDDTGPANTNVSILHNLQRLPVAYVWNPDQKSQVWSIDRANWTRETLKLRFSEPNLSGVLVVF